MVIRIVFYKSSSKYYDSVCLRCENCGQFVQEKSCNTLLIKLDEIRKSIILFRGILDTVKNWSKTEYYIDEERVSIHKIEAILSVLHCEGNCKKCVLSDEFCYNDAYGGRQRPLVRC